MTYVWMGYRVQGGIIMPGKGAGEVVDEAVVVDVTGDRIDETCDWRADGAYSLGVHNIL
jgi:hypothetical protein